MIQGGKKNLNERKKCQKKNQKIVAISNVKKNVCPFVPECDRAIIFLLWVGTYMYWDSAHINSWSHMKNCGLRITRKLGTEKLIFQREKKTLQRCRDYVVFHRGSRGHFSAATNWRACAPFYILLYPHPKGVKRGLSKVYFTLKYLEDNKDNVHFQSLTGVHPMSVDNFTLPVFPL